MKVMKKGVCQTRKKMTPGRIMDVQNRKHKVKY